MFGWFKYRRHVDCPCCGFPTLGERGQYEICTVCWWEDDGQNDATADEVWGGPNYEYSLTAARANFLDHGHMYDLGKGIDVVEHPLPERVKMVRYAMSVHSGDIPYDRKNFRRLLKRYDKARMRQWKREDAASED